MGRLVQLPATRLFRLGLASLGAALLVGLVVIVLALASSSQVSPDLFPSAVLAAAPTSGPTPHATPTAHATPGKSKGSPSGGGGALAASSSWLREGLMVLFLLLLGFGLVIVPLAIRSARAEQHQPIYNPGPRRSADEQVIRMSQIPPERKEPLSREQMLALRASQQPGADAARQSTGILPAMRLINGVPVSVPGAEARQLSRQPAPHQPGTSQAQDDRDERLPEEGASLL